MSNLDALILAAGLLSANHTAADHLIDAALYYGPGVVFTALATAAWHTLRRALDHYHQWADQRAERRHQAATAYRLATVTHNTDRIITAAGQHLAEQLRHQLYANDTHEGEK